MTKGKERTTERSVQELLEFIGRSTSPYHTVDGAKDFLREKGFEELSLEQPWSLTGEGSYYVDVFNSTLIAFHIGSDLRTKLRIGAAHTDFPGIRIKPAPLICENGYGKLNIETYGGLILNTWLDRPLSAAGKVVLRGDDPFTPRPFLVDLERPLVTIPNLAIHMNRQMNDGVMLNKQKDMLPLFAALIDIENVSKEEIKTLWERTLAEFIGCEAEDILSYELNLYPVEAGCAFGFGNEFISSPRLDNLTSVKACLEGISAAAAENSDGLQLAALFDNEEVGSRTKQGAGSLVLPQVIERIYGACGYSLEECRADVAGGFMLSADVAHAFHPNHPEKNDLTNKPLLNKGVVLKMACSQSYAGDAEAVAIVSELCREGSIPWQLYVNRSDIPGGSTLGSIASALLPIRTMDIGVPLLAMHSARETMGSLDQLYIEKLLSDFFVC